MPALCRAFSREDVHHGETCVESVVIAALLWMIMCLDRRSPGTAGSAQGAARED